MSISPCFQIFYLPIPPFSFYLYHCLLWHSLKQMITAQFPMKLSEKPLGKGNVSANMQNQIQTYAIRFSQTQEMFFFGKNQHETKFIFPCNKRYSQALFLKIPPCQSLSGSSLQRQVTGWGHALCSADKVRPKSHKHSLSSLDRSDMTQVSSLRYTEETRPRRCLQLQRFWRSTKINLAII